ncbi:MAG: hypothetical protein L0K86_28165, partial [Actinomycetia bacterium]|nr:hypothetical protein [Actinomycetes bacterium]
RAYEAVACVLRGLAADRTTLLLLDDLHNAGTATVELLHYLARHADRSRLLVLATIRAEEGAAAIAALAEVAERIEVGPLPARAVTRLAAEAGQAALAATIMRRTRGHTLFVVETLRGLAAGTGDAPASLQAVVLDRLRQVGPETEELLRAGSVLGATIDPDTVAAMLDLPAHVVVGRCARAEAARLLAVAGRSYEFANDLIQELLYASTPLPVRVAHHRRAANLLTHAPEAMAAHLAAAQDWPRAARAYLRAGEQAMGRWVAADAEALFGRALAAAERAAAPELLARALLARGRARASSDAFRTAVGDFQAAASTARSAGDRRSEMHALRELGGISAVVIGTSMDECVARLRAGLRIAESLGDRAAEADLLGYLAVIAGNRLRYIEALELALRAVRSGRAAGSDRALVRGLDALRNVHGYLGECAAQGEALAELEPLLRRLGDLDVFEWTVFESSFAAFGLGGRRGPDRAGAGGEPARRPARGRAVLRRAPGLARPVAGPARRGCRARP